MLIRRETPADVAAMDRVHRAAFEGAEPVQDESLIGLLGHLDYYPRFGFVPAATVGIEPDEPSWAEHFQVRALTAWDPAITGAFRYPDEFYAL